MRKSVLKKLESRGIDHPLVTKLDWSPLNQGGAKFCTHRLKVVQDSLVFRPSLGTKIFICAFGVPGLIILFSPLLLLFFDSENGWVLWLFALLIGGTFTAVAYFFFKAFAIPVVFDGFFKEVYHGFKKPEKTTPFKNIMALQLLAETVGRNESKFRSYELNLVLDNCSRINLVDHGDIEQLRKDAETLSIHIAAPVWDVA